MDITPPQPTPSPPLQTPPTTSTTTPPLPISTTTTKSRSRQTTIPFTKDCDGRDKLWGDNPNNKDPSHTRFFFQNVNGLPYGHPHDAILHTITPLHAIQADYIGLAETNLDFTRADIKYNTTSAFRKLFACSATVSYASSTIPFESSYKPGGCLMAAAGFNCSRIASSHQDSLHNLGRWSYFILRAKQNRNVAVVSAYRVCQSAQSDVPGPLTAYTQQRTLLREHHQNPNPKRIWDDHLHQQLCIWTELDYDIILMLDANDVLHNESKTPLWQALQDLGLVDAFHHQHPDTPPTPKDDPIITYQRGSRRLDYIFVSNRLAHSITRCGYLPYAQCIHSDHRGIFMDIDSSSLFGNLPPILPPTMRRLTTKHPHKVQKYLSELQQLFDTHNISDRSLSLYLAASTTKRPWTADDQNAYDTLDSDITRCMLAAENKCGGPTHSTPWFPALDRAIATKRYWQLRYKQQKFHISFADSIAILRSNHDIEDSDANDMPYITSQLNTAKALLKHLKKNGITLRFEHLNARAAQEAARHHQDEEHVLKRIIAAERFHEIFQRLRSALHRNQTSSLTRLKVPAEACDETTLEPNSYLDTYPTTSQNWITLEDKHLIERHLIARNNTHYRQANSTPFGTTAIGDDLGYHGTSQAATSILQGNYHPPEGTTLSEESTAYVAALQHPYAHLPEAERPTITSYISVEDLIQGFGHWPESTSTSPSGRHLGHYRSMLYLKDEEEGTYPLFEILHNMINIPLLTGRPPKRWLTASSVCIEKEEGNPQTDKIRIIHLYEADLNLVWKLLWGSRLVQHAEQLQLYPDAQYGSRPGRNSIDAVLCKILCYEFTRVTRSNMGLLDNDAMANYDRIICSLSSIACQRLGMPKIIEHLHNEILNHLRYNVKTGFGTSLDTYGAEPGNPVQGQGQGSGNAPSCWGAISTPMWSALRTLCAHSFKAHTADFHYNVDTQGVAFVDDATNLLNDISNTTPMDEQTLVNALQTLAQMWERLLFSTGGALKPPKCFWFAITWQWASGFPIMRSTNKFQHSIAITDSPTNTRVQITQKGPSEAERTLGVRIAPNGSQHRELTWLRSKAHSFALHISKGKLSREETYRAYHSVYIPSLTYSLGSTTFTQTEAKSIQKRSLNLILASMGINRNMPRPVVYTPTHFGGLGFKCLYTEQGCQQVENFIGHLRIQSTVGKLFRATLSMHQLTAGTSLPILSDPSTPIPYLEKGWITSLRTFLAHIDGTIEIANQFTLHPVRDNDQLLMDCLNDPSLPTTTVERINHCRLYLQVTTLADICNGMGDSILPAAYHGHPIPDSKSTIQWPRQPRPPECSWTAWQNALHKFFLEPDTRSLRLRSSAHLGTWLPSLHTHHRRWHYTVDPHSGHAWHTAPTSGTTKFHPSLGIPNPEGRFRATGTGRPISTGTVDPPTPSTAIPATVLLASSTTLLLSAHHSHLANAIPHQPTTHNPLPHNFATHLDSLPAWERRLLFTYTQQADTLSSTLLNSQVIIACDGSMKNHRLSFGWVIGSDTDISWTGQGPADGALPYHTSQRAELYGILAALRFLYQFTHYHNIHGGNKILLVCDNKSAIHYATPAPHQGSAIFNNHPDYDVVHEIHTTLRLLPIQVDLKWVKGHQNQHKNAFDLPRDAQLNIIADSLATSFHDLTDPEARSQPCPPPFPSCQASLIINGRRVVRNHKENIREAAWLPVFYHYLCKRNEWDDNTPARIDWTPHSRALHSLSVPARLSITKFLHRWLPTNHNLHKQTPSTPLACGLCQAPDETDDHVCRCPHTSSALIRLKALETLTSLLESKGTDPAITNLLTTGCRNWLDTGATTLDLQAPPTHPFPEILNIAISQQNEIGWNHFLRGRLSIAWGFCFMKWQKQPKPSTTRTADAPTRPIKHLDPDSWTTHIIKWAFDTVLDLWKNRNEHIFNVSEEHDTTEERIRLQAATREMHSRCPQDLPHSDLHAYFNEPIETLILRRNHVLRVWIAHVDRIYIRHRNEINQRTKRNLLTYYFTRRKHKTNQHSLP
jgi:ribonuclease HI